MSTNRTKYLTIQTRIRCKICGEYRKALNNAHLAPHGLTPTEYKEQFGVAKVNAIASREIMSEILRHRDVKLETKRKMSRNNKGKGNPRYGVKLSAKLRKRMSIIRKQKVLPNLDPEIEQQRREKIREANTGNKRPKSVGKKIGRSLSLRCGWTPEMAAFVRKAYLLQKKKKKM